MVIHGKHDTQWKAGENPAPDLLCSELRRRIKEDFEQVIVLRRDNRLFMRSWQAGARKDTGS